MAVVIGLNFSSCAIIKGAGPVVVENRILSGFNTIRCAIPGTVYLSQHPHYKVAVHAQKNIIEVLNTTLSGGELKIAYDHNKRISTQEPVSIFISCPDITGLFVSGTGRIVTVNKCTPFHIDLDVSGPGAITLAELNADHIHTRISGEGNITVLRGSTRAISSEVSGNGNLDLANLQSGCASICVSGNGNARVNVREELSISLSGNGNLYYKGDPAIARNISGPGKVYSL